MFDIGWTEMLVVAIVAILFVGPKELPGMLRTIGRSVKKLRAMAGDFQRQFNDALEEAELDGLRDTAKELRNLDPTKQIKDKLNPLKQEVESVRKAVNNDFDPKTLFDENKAPAVAEGQKVDVDAALARQKELDAQSAKLPPSSGKNAVPGFGGPAAAPEALAEAVAPAAEGVKARASAPAKASAKVKSTRTTAEKKVTASKTATRKTSAAKSAAVKAGKAKTPVKSATAPKSATTEKSASKPASVKKSTSAGAANSKSSSTSASAKKAVDKAKTSAKPKAGA